MGQIKTRRKGCFISIRKFLLFGVIFLVIGMILPAAYYFSLVPCEQTGNSWAMDSYPSRLSTRFQMGHIMFDNRTLWVGQSFSYGEALENMYGTLVFSTPVGAAFIVHYPGDYHDQLPITCRLFVKLSNQPRIFPGDHRRQHHRHQPVCPALPGMHLPLANG